MKGGELTCKILETVAKTTIGMVDLWEATIRAGYGASYGEIQKELEKIETGRIQESNNQEKKQRFYSLIYQLKKSGLIEEITKRNKKVLSLTHKGREKYVVLKDYLLTKPKRQYLSVAGDTWVIVAFDIPEKERGKRGWLRDILKILGFEMLQKSLWIGKKKIPKDFLNELFRLNLVDHIEIFEITKTGTLKHLV